MEQELEAREEELTKKLEEIAGPKAAKKKWKKYQLTFFYIFSSFQKLL